MRLAIRHETRYSYGAPVDYAVQRLYLTPSETAAQRVVRWTIHAAGIDNALRFTDGFGNTVHLVTTAERHEEAVIVAEGVVDVEDHAGVVGAPPSAVPDAVFLRQTRLTQPDKALRALTAEAMAKDTAALGRLHALMLLVHERVVYEVGATHAYTTAAEALSDRRGVCQDHAHVFLSAARLMGIPARYVTGYLAIGIGQSSAASHAWAEALVPDLGWVGFDPANGIGPRDGHVRAAAGLDAAGVTPIRGSRRGGLAETMSVAVSVEPGEP
jgi:transglutaminase-like putative cysteine protease